jgi:hypothetical protein
VSLRGVRAPMIRLWIVIAVVWFAVAVGNAARHEWILAVLALVASACAAVAVFNGRSS